MCGLPPSNLSESAAACVAAPPSGLVRARVEASSCLTMRMFRMVAADPYFRSRSAAERGEGEEAGFRRRVRRLAEAAPLLSRRGHSFRCRLAG